MKNIKRMKLLILTYLIFGTLIMQNSCIKAQTMKYIYADGSGNSYIVTDDSIEYNPIKKEMSSSGNYSGGEYIKNKIDNSNFEIVGKIFNDIFNKKNIHIKNRIMTSGQLEIYENNKLIDKIIIKPDCYEINELEGILKKMITKTK